MGVTGIGGFFFRSADPAALSAWYLEHLGVGANMAAGEYVWQQSAGPTVFAPFKADTDYFAADKAWMLNLRVEGLDTLLAKLRAAGIEVVTKAEWDTPETGRFARIHDPEGNAVELWEPPVG
jgi:predicted enzyme related to lactoylglutathione lyase